MHGFHDKLNTDSAPVLAYLSWKQSLSVNVFKHGYRTENPILAKYIRISSENFPDACKMGYPFCTKMWKMFKFVW